MSEAIKSTLAPFINIAHNVGHTEFVGDDRVYDTDTGPLAIPRSILPGGTAWDGEPITSMVETVDEYPIWLNDQVQKGNEAVMTELQSIYERGMEGVVILATKAKPSPNITHADQIRRYILRMIRESGHEA